jgi:hypothetical protein
MLHFSALDCTEIYPCLHIKLGSVINEVKSTQRKSYSWALRLAFRQMILEYIPANKSVVSIYSMTAYGLGSVHTPDGVEWSASII